MTTAALVYRDKYDGDRKIRRYRQLGLAALLHDIGHEPINHITIIGGIGTLTMYADGREDWKPTLPNPPPRQAEPELTETRKRVCQECKEFRDSQCSASGCGCAGEGKPEVWSSRCPLGKWPSIDCNP